MKRLASRLAWWHKLPHESMTSNRGAEWTQIRGAVPYAAEKRARMAARGGALAAGAGASPGATAGAMGSRAAPGGVSAGAGSVLRGAPRA
jgi:hypothetical protein